MMKALPIPKIKMNQVWCWLKENLLLVLTFLGELPYGQAYIRLQHLYGRLVPTLWSAKSSNLLIIFLEKIDVR